MVGHASAVISGIGMATSLGHDAITACAASRAGLSNITELTIADFAGDARFGEETLEGAPGVFGHQVTGLADGFTGVGKALMLAIAALQDLQRRRAIRPAEVKRTGLCLNLSDGFMEDALVDMRAAANPEIEKAEGKAAKKPSERWRQTSRSLLLPKLLKARGFAFQESNVHIQHGAHAGLAACLAQATAMLQSGQAERCIVGGVDSRIDVGFLTAAAELGVLKTSGNPVGLIPGEAAAFFLLERTGVARRAGVKPLARLGAVAQAHEPLTMLAECPPTGGGLCTAMRAALSADPTAALGMLVSDLNGSPRRAAEWSYALTRISKRALSTLPKWYPVESFGDVGAAAGPLAVCLVARAFERGYAPAQAAMLVMSSERGERGSITLHAVR